MTSAARPTFLPAVGGHSLRDTRAGEQTYRSAKDLNAHLALKLRQPLAKVAHAKKESTEFVLGSAIVDPDIVASSSEEDSDDDDDDEVELMRQLNAIKQERALAKKEREMESAEINPLMTSDAPKRKWDEDVVFRNQSVDQPQPRKRFINDMLRSDFHRKFMLKYCR